MQISGQWLLCDDDIVRPIIRGAILAADDSWQEAEFLVDIAADRTVFTAEILTALGLQPIAEQAQQIGQLEGQVQQVLDRMRRHVEKRALKAGRRDILERLPATTDLDQFDAWLAEME